MKLYYYCSYTESPVGYILGRLNYDSCQTKNYRLSKENIPPLIRKCFESGIIRRAVGILPSESKSTYFLLVKKLTAKTGEGNDALNYYLNLALETEERAEFDNWLRKETTTAEELADAIKLTIELDQTSDFGFTVRCSELKSLVQHSFRSLFPNVSLNDKAIYFKLSSAQIDSSRLKELIGIPYAEFSQIQGTEMWFYSDGKKKYYMGLKAVIMIRQLKEIVVMAVRRLKKIVVMAVCRLKKIVVMVIRWLKEKN